MTKEDSEIMYCFAIFICAHRDVQNNLYETLKYVKIYNLKKLN